MVGIIEVGACHSQHNYNTHTCTNTPTSIYKPYKSKSEIHYRKAVIMMPPNNETKPFLTDMSDHDIQQHKIGRAKQLWHSSWTQSAPSHSRAFWLMSHTLACSVTSLMWLAILWLSRSAMSPWMCSQFLSSVAQPHYHPGLATDVNHNFTAHSQLLTCGHSTQEAKSMGCKYDILSNHWIPGVCMDEDAVKEYQMDGSWYGYADSNRTQLLSYESMGDMDLYYTSMRDHIVHCAVLWKK
ncbi:hypothetical protein M431DRAFT_486544 [Trichoderma harzianum CBS 226.95]|uniref:Uncharacterized protein n=1 Tax=Trichoderma harzianum CBS 226.95 TaxID=983964 RepID=A0A2T3ZXT1_TRIHA|nr:hypothetical protein M431DRAFT_486544 [Trichoderma harzianum CBS 226.95]PTB49543.1 hypothetical protein M431DRAFT_486544 [Trichoderma harzianum CBS 226.95]